MRRKILIADDEVGVRESYRMIFKDGYEVLEAGNGDEALKILQNTRPDVILLDIIMPHMNGVEVLKEIKNIDKQLPVIVITAIKNTQMGKEAMKLGAFAYLTKPFDVMELQQVVQRALIQK
jgi:DNA-binding NtrC family response regulator